MKVSISIKFYFFHSIPAGPFRHIDHHLARTLHLQQRRIRAVHLMECLHHLLDHLALLHVRATAQEFPIRWRLHIRPVRANCKLGIGSFWNVLLRFRTSLWPSWVSFSTGSVHSFASSRCWMDSDTGPALCSPIFLPRYSTKIHKNILF